MELQASLNHGYIYGWLIIGVRLNFNQFLLLIFLLLLYVIINNEYNYGMSKWVEGKN